MADVETDEPESAATLERRRNIALITLNRPQALNAVNAEVSAALGAALEEFAADPGLRVAVVTGAGRAFCAGMDLKEAAAGRDVMDPLHPEWGFAGIVRHSIGKPLIAAVNGPALGGGAEIVLACDLVVADENATFGMPEVRHGLYPAAGGVLRLQHRVPRNIAREIALTGTPVDAATAARWGLFNRVAPSGKSVDVALELAERVAAGAPLAVHAVKQLMSWGEGQAEAEAWVENDRTFQEIRASDDAKEGPRAFAEKRTPHWTGR
ncbi:putative enoyl-CoA hydratase/isomerase family protein [Streptomyces bingchenggensis BCW-1]|uniref:enoyl-CoA hydratase n=1 Tax=Streptomyces bingchenggensis (strain BCW-1) TaxID=749414 RepID=D7BW59_STRBB|nr:MULTISPECIES: crotonase/enoyl-CoA hydratase family protein [Streptomyces]ADI11769.1 putative enoyl-CoA hydratase/isomerase family protein [Streptomyces bingchenggensis BCW-1]